MVLLLTSTFTIIACQSKAQEHPGPIYQKILPGDTQLDISKILPHSIPYRKFRGKMIYHLSHENNELFRLFIDFKVNGKNSPDTVYFSRETLGFRSRHFYNGFAKYTGKLSFSDKTLTGSIRPEEGSSLSSPLLYDKVYVHEVFEPAMLHYVLSALPLKKGYTASLPMLDLNDGSSIIWANIKVESQQTMKENGKTYSVWQITSQGSRNKTFWLSTEQPFFVKMKNSGVRFNWKIDQ